GGGGGVGPRGGAVGFGVGEGEHDFEFGDEFGGFERRGGEGTEYVEDGGGQGAGGADLHFAVGALQVALHGGDADVQILGDLAIFFALQALADDVDLAGA